MRRMPLVMLRAVTVPAVVVVITVVGSPNQRRETHSIYMRGGTAMSGDIDRIGDNRKSDAATHHCDHESEMAV